jgi:hypothetical protein
MRSGELEEHFKQMQQAIFEDTVYTILDTDRELRELAVQALRSQEDVEDGDRDTITQEVDKRAATNRAITAIKQSLLARPGMMGEEAQLERVLPYADVDSLKELLDVLDARAGQAGGSARYVRTTRKHRCADGVPRTVYTKAGRTYVSRMRQSAQGRVHRVFQAIQAHNK